MAANNYQANITQGSYSVDIIIEKVEHNFDKALQDFQIPKTDPPLTWIVDLKRLKELITINGYLEDSASESGLAKKRNLRAIMQNAGTMTLTWNAVDGDSDQEKYEVNIQKCNISEISEMRPASDNYASPDTKTYTIMISFIVGTHKG